MTEDQKRMITKQVKQEIISDEDVRKYIVIRQIVKIREERNKQTIKEAVDAILLKNMAEKSKRSKKVEKYVKREFEFKAAQAMKDEDILYNRVIVNMQRLLKVLTGHSSAIDSLERKLREIQQPKQKKKMILKALRDTRSKLGRNKKYTGEDDNENDDGGISVFDEKESNNEDEIDIMSEGEMEREIMMDQIRMGEIGDMEEYQKYNLQVEDMRDLDMQDSDEL
jgi:hypothetical protein